MAEPAETKPTLLLGVRYFERKDNPPPGLVWRKGLKGETLGSIADDYGIRWIDLALYNWHTAKLAEVNWYLKHFVGCTLNNGKTYSFSGIEKSLAPYRDCLGRKSARVVRMCGPRQFR